MGWDKAQVVEAVMPMGPSGRLKVGSTALTGHIPEAVLDGLKGWKNLERR